MGHKTDMRRYAPTRGGRAKSPSQLTILNKIPNDEWYTPIELIRSLGEFDLDPACGPGCPNKTARRRYAQRGEEKPWAGRVWLNPPFSNVVPWVDRMIEHGNGVLFVFGRVDAVWFQRAAAASDGVYLLRGRVQFQRTGGTTGRCPLGCVLFGFGARNRRAIQRCGYPGIWLTTDH